ncbi:hypothetical protein HDE_12141 [Halotydeus destructor]|nr:hypothetical protein HDE_12141 [Halotydeus destructor]
MRDRLYELRLIAAEHEDSDTVDWEVVCPHDNSSELQQIVDQVAVLTAAIDDLEVRLVRIKCLHHDAVSQETSDLQDVNLSRDNFRHLARGIKVSIMALYQLSPEMSSSACRRICYMQWSLLDRRFMAIWNSSNQWQLSVEEDLLVTARKSSDWSSFNQPETVEPEAPEPELAQMNTQQFDEDVGEPETFTSLSQFEFCHFVSLEPVEVTENIRAEIIQMTEIHNNGQQEINGELLNWPSNADLVPEADAKDDECCCCVQCNVT